MTLEKKMRSQFGLYTSDRRDIKEFRRWFSSFLRHAHASGDDKLKTFAHETEWLLVDFEQGSLDESNLKLALTELLNAAFPTSEGVEILVEGLYFPVAQLRVDSQEAGAQDAGLSLSGVFVRGNGILSPSLSESPSCDAVIFTSPA